MIVSTGGVLDDRSRNTGEVLEEHHRERRRSHRRREIYTERQNRGRRGRIADGEAESPTERQNRRRRGGTVEERNQNRLISSLGKEREIREREASTFYLTRVPLGTALVLLN
ncbi:hypothetical protein F2Q70_00041829 [Brassica cretica]|uniref:Uncharacterized protein n=1 Tax=Brassica cretica TaxID=69181 RepID=A0A8S9KC59_BRACR|nr:hypothetical protein F2Q70_00041829 [Brassica cretica]